MSKGNGSGGTGQAEEPPGTCRPTHCGLNGAKRAAGCAVPWGFLQE